MHNPRNATYPILQEVLLRFLLPLPNNYPEVWTHTAVNDTCNEDGIGVYADTTNTRSVRLPCLLTETVVEYAGAITIMYQSLSADETATTRSICSAMTSIATEVALAIWRAILTDIPCEQLYFFY